MWDSPFAYVVFMSGSGLVVAIIIHLVGWFYAPERIIPYLHPPE
jgi:hypothetical protein